MISRGKTLAAALALCALSICAFAAASASASELTAVTCKEVTPAGSGQYNNSHCNTPKVASSNFETVALPLNTPTNVTGGTTEGGTAEPALRATLGGASVTIICGSGESIGPVIVNREPSAGKHTIEGSSTRTTYSNCHAVLMSNEARFCSVSGTTAPGGVGMISTTALVGRTTGVEHKLKVEPAAGAATEFTKFTIQKKGTNATENECFFNNDVAVEAKGAVEGEANTTKHSHATFTAANNGTALKVNGSTATLLDTAGGVMEGTENTVGAETFT